MYPSARTVFGAAWATANAAYAVCPPGYIQSGDSQTAVRYGWTSSVPATCTFSSQVGIPSSPVTDGAAVYFGSADNGGIFALNASTGMPLWQLHTNDKVAASPAIGPDGTLFIGSFDGLLYAIRGTAGASYGGGGSGRRMLELLDDWRRRRDLREKEREEEASRRDEL